MTELELFAQELRIKRRHLHLTQEQTAELLSVSSRWYQKLEYGKSSPNFALICKMAKIFEIDFSDFCKEDTNNDYIEITNRHTGNTG